MNLRASFLAAFIAASLATAATGLAQHDHHAPPAKESSAATGRLIRVTEKDAAWAAKRRASYPLDTCVSSGEKLGNMGDSAEFIYRVEGKPDRLVVFCCAGCDEDFLSDPAKHLAKIDAAAKAGGKSDSKQDDAHQGHH